MKNSKSRLTLSCLFLASLMSATACSSAKENSSNNESSIDSSISQSEATSVSSSIVESSKENPIIESYKIIFVIGDKQVKVEEDKEKHTFAVPEVAAPAHRRFTGWSRNVGAEFGSNADKKEFSLEELKDLFEEGKDTATLYAAFCKVASVTFVLDTPKTVELDQILLNVADIANPAKEGFDFLGWNTNKDAASAQISSKTDINYDVVKGLLDANCSVSLYPIFREVVSSAITLHKYFESETMPTINIATEGGIAIDDKSLINPNEHKGMMGEIPVYNYVGATINVSGGEAGTDIVDAAAQVKVRGNYTSTYAKKPIRLKFGSKTPMLGLNSGKKFKNWVLLAEWKDPSLLRNSVADFLGNTLLESDGFYCTDYRFVKVYINNSYNGVYVLAEQQQIDKDRVNIPESKVETDGVDTGYLLEYDGYYKSEPEIQRFEVSYNNVNARNKGFSITNDIMNQAQHDYIAKVVQSVWNVTYDALKNNHSNLASAPYHTMNSNGDYVADTSIKSAKEAVESVIDLKSLVNMYILNEICEDSDIGWSSFNFSIDMSNTGNKLLTYNAPWDFDYALGNNVSGSAMKPTMVNQSQMVSDGRLTRSGNSYKLTSTARLKASDFTFSNKNTLFAATSDNPWFSVFSGASWFWEMVNERWDAAVNAGVFTKASEMIDTLSDLYVNDFKENFTKWSQAMGKKIDMNQSDYVTYFVNQRQAADMLKIWLDTRVEGLSTAFAAKK